MHAALGRAYAARSQPTRAEAEYERVVALWQDPKRAAAEVEGAELAETSATMAAGPQRGRQRLAGALDAVSEALFALAEYERQRRPLTPVRRFSGPPSPQRVRDYSRAVSEILILHADRARELSMEYKRIVDLQPTVSPRWVIAAGARVGDLWADIVRAGRATSPMAGQANRQLVEAYDDALREALEPWVLHARGAFEVCLAYSVKYKYSDAWSRRCEDWLVRHFPDAYTATEDFLLVPTWRAPQPTRDWAALDRRGALVEPREQDEGSPEPGAPRVHGALGGL